MPPVATPVPPAPASPPAPAAQVAPPPAPAVASAPQASPASAVTSQVLVETQTYDMQPVGQTGLVPVSVDWNADMKSIASAQGFGDLDFTAFGIFPIITLTNDLKFTLSTGGDLGQEFYCHIHEGRKKYLYSNGLQITDRNSEVAYSYDQKTYKSGQPLEELLTKWRSQGYTPTMKTYMELVCKLDDDRVGLLSVPPTSISRFTAFVADTIQARVLVPQAYCRVSVGEKVTNVPVPFHPMKFEMVR